jgi:hypothetical protein
MRASEDAKLVFQRMTSVSLPARIGPLSSPLTTDSLLCLAYAIPVPGIQTNDLLMIFTVDREIDALLRCDRRHDGAN